MKPLIGITASMSKDQDPLFSAIPRDYLSSAYSKAIIRAGGIPVIIPVCTDSEITDEIVERLDGILMSGGPDASPILFGEEPMEKLSFTYQDRDMAEIAIIKKALKLKKPMFCICRGMQLLSCVKGGTMYQDLSYFSKNSLKHVQDAFPDYVTHSIEISDDSIIKEAFGDNNLVNSYHHQVIKKQGKDLKVTAKAKDGAIEALESSDPEQLIMAFQFHPELLSERYPYAQKLFDIFIEKVNERINKKGRL